MNEKQSKVETVLDVLAVIGVALMVLGFLGMVYLSATFHFGVGQVGRIAMLTGASLWLLAVACRNWRNGDRPEVVVPATVALLGFGGAIVFTIYSPQTYAVSKARHEKYEAKMQAVQAVLQSLPSDVPLPRDVMASDHGELRTDKDGNPLPETVIKVWIPAIRNSELAGKVEPAFVSVRVKDGRLVVSQVEGE
jgi:hypothetical protein